MSNPVEPVAANRSSHDNEQTAFDKETSHGSSQEKSQTVIDSPETGGRPSNADVLRKAWTRRDLIVSYSGSFQKHSALSTSNVVNTVVALVTYPIMAKFSNVFGRAEGLFVSILFLLVALVMFAACQNIGTYFAGAIFDSIGDTGFGIMMQVFIADTTSLIDRGLWTSLPDSLASIPTLYLGTEVADSVLKHSTWRWGYGMWAIILPFCAAPLIITLYILQRRARHQGYNRSGVWGLSKQNIANGEHVSFLRRVCYVIWVELDFVGGFLLVAGLALALIPLTLTGSRNASKWTNGGYIAMLVIGVVIFVVFLVWEIRFARVPIMPFRMVKERTVVAACCLSMMDFFHYSVFTVFFPSYLQVTKGITAGQASRIDNSLRVSFEIGSVIVGLAMKYTRRTQIYVYMGVPLMVLGMGVLMHLVSMENGTKTGNTPSLVTAKVLIGLGRSFYQTAAQVSIQALVAHEDVPVVTGIYYASMSLGGAIGTSVAGAIWDNVLPNRLRRYLPEENQAQARRIYGSMVVAKNYTMGSPAREAINHAYRDTQRMLGIAAVVATALMLFVMFGLKTIDLAAVDKDKIDENRSTDGEGDDEDSVAARGVVSNGEKTVKSEN